MSAAPSIHSSSFMVSHCDTDLGGVVHHARYFEFLERARLEWLRDLGIDYMEVETSGSFLTIAEASCRYLLPIGNGETMTIRTHNQRLRRVSMDVEQVVKRGDGQVAAVAKLRVAMVSGGRPVPFLESWRRALQR